MTQYLTKEGLLELKAELKNINEVRLPQIQDAVKKALAEGDLRENAALDAAKSERELLQTRLQEVEDILNDYQIIEDKVQTGTKRVNIGSQVTITYLVDNTTLTLKIVGSSESDAVSNKISNESPLAKAVLGKKEGDEATFKVKNNSFNIQIVEILS